MKSFEEFTTEDLQAFLKENGFIRASKRGNEPGVVDYDKLTEIWGCKSRQARNIVAGRLPLQRSQYNLLALHSGAMRPQLCAQTFFAPRLCDSPIELSEEEKREAANLLEMIRNLSPAPLLTEDEYRIAISEHVEEPEPPRPA